MSSKSKPKADSKKVNKITSPETTASTTQSTTTTPSTTRTTITATTSLQGPLHGSLVYPGDRLGVNTDGTIIGDGVHIIEKYVYASVLGAFSKTLIENTTQNDQNIEEPLELHVNNTMNDNNGNDEKKKLKILKNDSGQHQEKEKIQIEEEEEKKNYKYDVISIKLQPSLPQIGETVICRVTEIQTRQIFLEILFTEGSSEPLSQCRGVIRSRDIRSLDTDGVVTYDSFRPGDIIKANIISLGDVRSYYLSTAKTHLGVVYAENVKGIGMILIPPKEEFKTTSLVQYMKCPITGSIQPRKAALP